MSNNKKNEPRCLLGVSGDFEALGGAGRYRLRESSRRLATLAPPSETASLGGGCRLVAPQRVVREDGQTCETNAVSVPPPARSAISREVSTAELEFGGERERKEEVVWREVVR